MGNTAIPSYIFLFNSGTGRGKGGGLRGEEGGLVMITFFFPL